MASFIISQFKGDLKKCAMVASTVSSKMIKAVAEKNGVHYEETLTGFKWLGNKAIELDNSGLQVLFSYEEAIGFCVGNLVRDKDGIVAGACLAQLYHQLSSKGLTFSDYLNEQYQKLVLTFLIVIDTATSSPRTTTSSATTLRK